MRSLTLLAAGEPGIAVFSAVSTSALIAANAVAFHDTATRRILVRGAHLPALASGQVYVLWALDRGDDGKTPRNLAAFTGGQPVIDAVVSDAVAPSSLKALAISIERDPRIAAPTQVVAAGGAP